MTLFRMLYWCTNILSVRFWFVSSMQALEIEMDLDDPDNGGAKADEVPQQVCSCDRYRVSH